MPNETGKIVQFEASPRRIWLLALGALGMTVLSLAVAVPLLPNVALGSVGQFFGLVGVAFFGLCSVLLVRQALSLRGPVVTLTPEGLRDSRVSAGTVPWHAVQGIGVWEHSGQKVLVVQIPDEVWAVVGPTRIARLTRAANAKLGADGYCITAQGLAGSFDELRATVIAYAEAYHARTD